jgi:hypothetical protein
MTQHTLPIYEITLGLSETLASQSHHNSVVARVLVLILASGMPY